MIKIKKVHELKCWPEHFELTIRGLKPFEVRYNDRGFEASHHILLKEWDYRKDQYTGRTASFVISSILADSSFLATGYIVLGLKKDRSNIWRLHNKKFRNECRKKNYKKSSPVIRKHRPWTEWECSLTVSGLYSDAEIAKRLERSVQSIQQKRYKLSLQK